MDKYIIDGKGKLSDDVLNVGYIRGPIGLNTWYTSKLSNMNKQLLTSIQNVSDIVHKFILQNDFEPTNILMEYHILSHMYTGLSYELIDENVYYDVIKIELSIAMPIAMPPQYPYESYFIVFKNVGG